VGSSRGLRCRCAGPTSRYPYPPPRPAGAGAAVTAIVPSLIIALCQAFACIGYLAPASELSEAGNAAREWVPGFLIVEGARTDHRQPAVHHLEGPHDFFPAR
jgi:hypothetical protein